VQQWHGARETSSEKFGPRKIVDCQEIDSNSNEEMPGMQQWHKGPRAETATTRQNENKWPMWWTAIVFEEGEDNHKRHRRVELRTPITSGK
jgi:hypothetical protein